MGKIEIGTSKMGMNDSYHQIRNKYINNNENDESDKND